MSDNPKQHAPQPLSDEELEIIEKELRATLVRLPSDDPRYYSAEYGLVWVSRCRQLLQEAARFRGELEDMAYQFAYATVSDGHAALSTGGLSALEGAFEALGWENPHPTPERECDEPGCPQHATCGFPTATGYRRTCGEHSRHAPEQQEPPQDGRRQE